MDQSDLPDVSLDGAHVLIVDDEPAIRAVLKRLMARQGYRFSAAADGAEAMGVLTSNAVDAVISDISMPNVDGVSFLRALRSHDTEIPVILMTGRPTFRSAVDAVELGAFHYLLKPFETQELLSVLRRALQFRKISRLRRAALRLNAGKASLDAHRMEEAFDLSLKSIWIAFQPILSTLDNSFFGYEALLRTGTATHPDPSAVLRDAVRLSRVRELGRCVQARVAREIELLPPDLSIFINLHPDELRDPNLLGKDSPVSRVAERVVLEITERASLDAVPNVKDRIDRLREIGYRIAIDDVGAGYSGLSSFVLLEPNVAKLDMTLVRHIDRTEIKQKLVRSVVELCDDLGILVVAEGIETSAERDAVSELGCHLLQGFLVGMPDRLAVS